jgi:hypothetical protein
LDSPKGDAKELVVVVIPRGTTIGAIDLVKADDGDAKRHTANRQGISDAADEKIFMLLQVHSQSLNQSINRSMVDAVKSRS